VPPPFFFENAVGKYLLTLSPCTAKVVVASPNYGDQHYRCEVIADAARLTPWAEHHAEAVWSLDNDEQAARKALPFWLRGANVDVAPSYIPPLFVAVLRPYALDLINEGIAQVLCQECRRIVRDIAMKKLNESYAGSLWAQWTDEWHCPSGHLLYREDHDIHIHRG
jgi:hypothetical protein